LFDRSGHLPPFSSVRTEASYCVSGISWAEWVGMDVMSAEVVFISNGTFSPRVWLVLMTVALPMYLYYAFKIRKLRKGEKPGGSPSDSAR